MSWSCIPQKEQHMLHSYYPFFAVGYTLISFGTAIWLNASAKRKHARFLKNTGRYTVEESDTNSETHDLFAGFLWPAILPISFISWSGSKIADELRKHDEINEILENAKNEKCEKCRK